MDYECDGTDVSGFEFLSSFDPLREASSDADALKKLHGAAQDLGFDQIMFAVIPQPKISTKDVYMRTSYPAEWRNLYERQNLREVDPTVEYCFKSTAPLVWMPQSFKTSAQQSLYEEASAFGLRVGVTLPIHGPSGEVGMLTCVRDQAPNAAFVKDLGQQLGSLTLLRDVAFDSMKKFIHAGEEAEEVPTLTARELDCLHWMAVGKTAWEIGRILSISEAGVNFHFSNLRNKFGVSKRNDVVLRAIRFGLISLPG